MNPIHSISDQEVLQKTDELALQERRIGAQLLEYLHEVEIRGLHLKRGYPSLYAYCTKALKLSEGAASRRISSMRLVYGLPSNKQTAEVLDALRLGQVNLSTLSAAQYFLQEQKKSKAPYTAKQKQELVTKITGKSKRECEVTFATLAPKPGLRKNILRFELF